VFQTADIIAIYGTSWVSRLISFFTGGPSHVAIVVKFGSSKVLFESTSLNQSKCLYHNKVVSGCQFSSPLAIIEQAIQDGGYVEVWRVAEGRKVSTSLMDRMAFSFVRRGARYDLRGALRSGTRIVKRWWMPASNAHRLFCSAAVYELLEVVGLVNQDNSAKYSPAKLMRTLREQGTYRKIDEITQYNWLERSGGEYCSR
jgi:hypothetical protein